MEPAAARPHAVERSFADLNRQWSADSDGLDPSLDSAHDYFAKLARLETDNLPRYEERFLQLLREQSDQNLSRLEQERSAIRAPALQQLYATQLEAFDKADAELTSMAMNIFKTCSFQMVVATPLKSVLTLEPFIGGACLYTSKTAKPPRSSRSNTTRPKRLKLPVVNT